MLSAQRQATMQFSTPIDILLIEDSPSDSEHANCNVPKPVDLEHFQAVVQSIQEFWFQIVKLPPKSAP